MVFDLDGGLRAVIRLVGTVISLAGTRTSLSVKNFRRQDVSTIVQDVLS